MYRQYQLKHSVSRKIQANELLLITGQKPFQQSIQEQLEGWKIELEVIRWSNGRVPWKLIRGWLKVKNKEPKLSCVPKSTPHKWWLDILVNFPWCPYPEFITLSNLHTWLFTQTPFVLTPMHIILTSLKWNFMFSSPKWNAKLLGVRNIRCKHICSFQNNLWSDFEFNWYEVFKIKM